MDRIEFYIDGYNFATATAKRDHTISFGGKTFKTAAEMFEICLDVIEPDLDNQLESVRKKLREKTPWYISLDDD